MRRHCSRLVQIANSFRKFSFYSPSALIINSRKRTKSVDEIDMKKSKLEINIESTLKKPIIKKSALEEVRDVINYLYIFRICIAKSLILDGRKFKRNEKS